MERTRRRAIARAELTVTHRDTMLQEAIHFLETLFSRQYSLVLRVLNRTVPEAAFNLHCGIGVISERFVSEPDPNHFTSNLKSNLEQLRKSCAAFTSSKRIRRRLKWLKSDLAKRVIQHRRINSTRLHFPIKLMLK